MDQYAYALHGDRLPALPDDSPAVGLPPPALVPGQQFGMNAAAMAPPFGIPKFFVKTIRKPGGEYETVEMVEIITPGDSKATPVQKVTDGIRAKYRDYYEHWKRTQTMAPVGSPLEMWPMMTPAMVHQLKAANIFTVEQLANIADANLMHIPFGKTLRNQAQAWLAAKQDSDAIERATAQTQAMQDAMRLMEEKSERERAEMRAENADLRAKLDAVLGQLTAPNAARPAAEPAERTDEAPAPRRGPGRPPKADA